MKEIDNYFSENTDEDCYIILIANLPADSLYSKVKLYFIDLYKKIRRPRKYKHNVQVVKELYSDIHGVINSGYWGNDISKSMKDALLFNANAQIPACVNKALKKLK